MLSHTEIINEPSMQPAVVLYRSILHDLVHSFTVEAGEPETSCLHIVVKFKQAIENRLAWYIWQEGEIVGYLYAEVQPNEFRKMVLVIQNVYIKKKNGKYGFIREVDKLLVEAAKKRGIDELGFYTRRNPEAFIRHIGARWQLDSYVLKRKV